MLGAFVLTAVLALIIVIFELVAPPKPKRQNELPGLARVIDIIRYYMPLMGKPNYEIMRLGAEYFGPVYEFRHGSCVIIPLHDMKLAKHVMSSPLWKNRFPANHIIYERSKGGEIGILFGNDHQWDTVRDFSVKTLAKLGFGKGLAMETCVMLEVEETIAKLKAVSESFKSDDAEEQYGIFQPHGFFHIPTLNILWQLMAGQRFSSEDAELKTLLLYFYRWNRSFNLGATPIHLFPWLRRIPGLTEHDAWVDGHFKFRKFFRNIMKKRIAEGKFQLMQEDFIDMFLYEMHQADPAKRKVFTEDQFTTLCTDLFLAGADTTSNLLEFAILYMVDNPKVQSRIQQEIDTVIGINLPSLVYKTSMPYTEATTLEILRKACVIPVTGRCPKMNMDLNGYSIQKGSLIAINIHGMHYDQMAFDNPDELRPERFLDKQGNICNADKIIPFGYGKRKCLGEAASRSSFFLFFVSLMQNFTFKVSPHHERPSNENICGLSRAPKPYFVEIKQRRRGI